MQTGLTAYHTLCHNFFIRYEQPRDWFSEEEEHASEEDAAAQPEAEGDDDDALAARHIPLPECLPQRDARADPKAHVAHVRGCRCVDDDGVCSNGGWC